MAEDLGEKTEDPTPKRLSEAREHGEVVRSADLSAAVVLTGSGVLLYFFGGELMGGMGSYMRLALEPESLALGGRTEAIDSALRLAASVSLRLLTPVMLIMALIAWADQLAQVGWNFTMDPLTPKFTRLSPLKGIKNIFSRRSLVKGLVNVVKLIVIAIVAMMVIGSDKDRIIALPALTAAGGMLLILRLIVELGLWVLVILIVIGAIDRAYQAWQYTHDHRMTKQEVKEERKSSEGDPETKSRRMRLAREIARQRLKSAVPKADVIVTNPTHYAVAIKYDHATMGAPRVVAKGADHLAIQIRLLAAAHQVPIIERKELARALYRAVEVGQEVPADLYEAVAEVLAYVYRLEGRLEAHRADAARKVS